MAKRRDYESLSAAYQKRLERNGITPEKFNAGVDIRAARGHGITPERPAQARRNPAAFPKYSERFYPTEKKVKSGRLPDSVGYPGKENIHTAIFTLNKGWKDSEGMQGSITFIEYDANRDIVSTRFATYDMSEFKELIAEAKQSNYITQVVSTTGGL